MPIKLLHCGLSLLIDIFTTDDFLYRKEDNLEVSHKRDVVNIPYIEFKLFRPADGIASVTLRPARNTRTNLVAACLLGAVKGLLLHEQRTRRNEWHVALHLVDELRQFVDGRRAHETTHRSQSVGIRQQVALRIALIGHGLELDDLEDIAVLTRTFLEEECPCPFVGKVKPKGNGQEERPDDGQSRQYDDKVYQSFEKVFVHIVVS